MFCLSFFFFLNGQARIVCFVLLLLFFVIVINSISMPTLVHGGGRGITINELPFAQAKSRLI
jgi:hypothetical protein